MLYSKAFKWLVFTVASSMVMTITTPAAAQSPASSKVPGQLASQDPTKDQVYGWQLMSDAERDAYKKQLGSFKNSTERDVFLQDHKARMNIRAREKGITLHDTTAASSHSSRSPASAMPTPNDVNKPMNNNATQIRPGTGAGPYKDK